MSGHRAARSGSSIFEMCVYDRLDAIDRIPYVPQPEGQNTDSQIDFDSDPDSGFDGR